MQRTAGVHCGHICQVGSQTVPGGRTQLGTMQTHCLFWTTVSYISHVCRMVVCAFPCIMHMLLRHVMIPPQAQACLQCPAEQLNCHIIHQAVHSEVPSLDCMYAWQVRTCMQHVSLHVRLHCGCTTRVWVFPVLVLRQRSNCTGDASGVQQGAWWALAL